MIAKGEITKRAATEQMPAQTIERDYVLSHVCAEIGARDESRLVFKGGTLLRLCYFDEYRYSADLDFSTTDGLTRSAGLALIEAAVSTCRQRLEMNTLSLTADDGTTAWITYVGPLAAKPRTVKMDISDRELVEQHHRLAVQPRWSDLPSDAAIEGYTLDEVGAEKLRCIAERVQCRDFFDLYHLLDGHHIDPLETWELYVRKAANDVVRGQQRTPPREWSSVFTRRLNAYNRLWVQELSSYIPPGIPAFADIERRMMRLLKPVVAAASRLLVE